jgi:hypothetical protein
MKKLFWTAAFMLMPALGFSQSTLNFPRSFTQQDRQSTGFAIVNPGPIDAAATFTLWGGDGSALATANRTIPRGGSRSLDQT